MIVDHSMIPLGRIAHPLLGTTSIQSSVRERRIRKATKGKKELEGEIRRFSFLSCLNRLRTQLLQHIMYLSTLRCFHCINRTSHKALKHKASDFCVHPYGGPPKEGLHAIMWKDDCSEGRLQLDLYMLRGQ